MPEETKDQGKPSGQSTEQKFKIKVQGQEKEVPLSELMELAQKGEDYTKKTQELSEKESKMQEDTQKKAEELAYDWIAQQEEDAKKTSIENDDSLDPNEKRIKALEDQIGQLKGTSEESKVAQYELQFETKLKECKGKYPNCDERVVLAILSSNPDLDMDKVAKENHESKEKERDEWVTNYLDEKKKQPKSEAGGPSSITSGPPKDFKGKDFMKGDVKRAATVFVQESLQE